ncbi:MAG: MerR family transcriptional regulator [Lachnospiraceae bacterium]|nr:MerR family transcriptional regulator [Lachnospiraceae bacterium]
MPKYKVGEIARMLGLSSETLRYYESHGIITPYRDESSGYRYYEAWDINYLLDSIWYRSFGFSLNDVEQMINRDDLSQFKTHCRSRESELLQLINEYQQKLRSLALLRQNIERIPLELGTFTPDDSPALIWQCQRTNDTLNDNTDEVRRWVQLMPFIEHTFVMPSVTPDRDSFNDYSWGFSLSPEKAAQFNIDMSNPGVQYIPSYRSIRTVFHAGDNGTFIDAFSEQVLRPLKEQGLQIAHPPIGHLLVRIHEDGHIKRFFKVWIPVE